MSWMNEPGSAKISGSAIAVGSRAKTNLWKKTFAGSAADSGHLFHLPARGDVTFTACMSGAATV